MTTIIPSLVLYVTIALVPLWMIPFHAAVQRLLAAIGLRVGVQLGGIVSAAAANLLLAVVVFRWSHELLRDDALDAAAGLVLMFMALNAMSFFYFQLINVALTSIHIAVVLRIYWSDGLSEQGLLNEYSSDQMLTERLDRLSQLGQIKEHDGIVELRSRIFLVLCQPIYLWRRILRVTEG